MSSAKNFRHASRIFPIRTLPRPHPTLFPLQTSSRLPLPIISSTPVPHTRTPTSLATNPHPLPTTQQTLNDSAFMLAKKWAAATATSQTTDDLVANLSTSPTAVSFVMKFTDWVMRPADPTVAARALSRLVSTDPIPAFLSSLDALSVRLGALFAPALPTPVVSLARLRMRSIVSTFIGPVENIRLSGPEQRNVNLLGEAVLGEEEATRRREEAQKLLKVPGVNYVSVKVSGLTSQLNRWDFEGSLDRVKSALRPLFQHAVDTDPKVLINLDMEEYHDLEITMAAFTSLLEEPQFLGLDAGIVLQTYLPDALPALQKLVSWANNRPGNAEIKIRLVKGANLAMEKVDASTHGWEQAPYDTKSDTDANYLRCLHWVLTPERTKRVRIGVASHNIFLLAYARTLALERNVANRVGFEMLQGMAPIQSPYLAKQGHGMLLYTPVCRTRDFDVAISYLFRRFEETSADGNFLRSLSGFRPESEEFKTEQTRFRTALAKMNDVSTGPRRKQERPASSSFMTDAGLTGSSKFVNEPNTDPALPHNRTWALDVLKPEHFKPVVRNTWVDSVSELRETMNKSRRAFETWNNDIYRKDRRKILANVADVLARRRGELINAMVHEGKKTFVEADAEVSEAIDFAHYYAIKAEELPNNFDPFGVVCVASPWNFPVAIPCGGVLAAIAAGNSAILKPAPITPRCAELVAECAWEAGVPQDVLQFAQVPENEVGKELITSSDAVILTGAADTADLFRSWKKDIRLFAETSGKNSLIISPAADLDLAVADLVPSAFSNTGQKCSAASLAICVGEVYNSDRFRRQLRDAAETMAVGDSANMSTSMGPLIVSPDEKLLRALTQLEDGEEWLLKPKCLDANEGGMLWTPGIRLGVKPGSWFHNHEVFGPVLGIMHATSIDDAIRIQNSTSFGLTGGIHSLDKAEIELWQDKVEVGNAYVNRGITGAMVQRQSFGGWKNSGVGPGAKAGGPNYISQLGTFKEGKGRDQMWLNEAILSDEKAWNDHFSKEQDPTGLPYETNVFRYRSLPDIAVRIGPNGNSYEAERVRAAIDRCGVKNVIWSDAKTESAREFAERVNDLQYSRIRVVGDVEEEVFAAAASTNSYLAHDPVMADGNVELQNYLREQSISRTRHRFGNLVTG